MKGKITKKDKNAMTSEQNSSISQQVSSSSDAFHFIKWKRLLMSMHSAFIVESIFHSQDTDDQKGM